MKWDQKVSKDQNFLKEVKNVREKENFKKKAKLCGQTSINATQISISSMIDESFEQI